MYEVPFQVIDILEFLVGEIGRSKLRKETVIVANLANAPPGPTRIFL